MGAIHNIAPIAFLYAIKLVGKNQQLVNKIFPDRIFGDVAPMHEKMTGMTSMVTSKAMKPAGLARDIALHQTGRGLTGAAKGVGKGVGAAAPQLHIVIAHLPGGRLQAQALPVHEDHRQEHRQGHGPAADPVDILVGGHGAPPRQFM